MAVAFRRLRHARWSTAPPHPMTPPFGHIWSLLVGSYSDGFTAAAERVVEITLGLYGSNIDATVPKLETKVRSMPIYNHTGQVVTDLERAKNFYQEVLGFTFWFEINPPEEATAKLCSLEAPLGVTACYLVSEGFTLELIHYAQPGVTASYKPRTMNEPGLTHLSISVDDIQATVAKALEHGGETIAESDIGGGLMIRDPDGQLIELLVSGFRESLPPRP